jgi:hypothetical protein
VKAMREKMKKPKRDHLPSKEIIMMILFTKFVKLQQLSSKRTIEDIEPEDS